MAERRRWVRRIAARVIVLLLLGAIINVAVAWGCVYWRPMYVGELSNASIYSDYRDHWIARVPRGYTQLPGKKLNIGQEFLGMTWINMCGDRPGFRNKEAAKSYPTLEEDDQGTFVWAGFPMRALYGDTFGTINVTRRGMILLPSGIELPYTPVWLGFAINTIFYAAIVWLLFTARLVLPRYRRLRRIKRGLCPACAYPVGTSDKCTECGKPVTRTCGMEPRIDADKHR